MLHPFKPLQLSLSNNNNEIWPTQRFHSTCVLGWSRTFSQSWKGRAQSSSSSSTAKTNSTNTKYQSAWPSQSGSRADASDFPDTAPSERARGGFPPCKWIDSPLSYNGSSRNSAFTSKIQHMTNIEALHYAWALHAGMSIINDRIFSGKIALR